jgi:hypothetical protein
MVEINTYYGKKYNAHKKIMQTVVFTCLPLLIVAVLANKGILPNNISTLLVGIIIVIGAVLIGMQIIDISNRDNMNFDEYNWYFNPTDAPTSSDENAKNPWETGSIVCIGSQCCYEGSTYDSNQNICVPNEQYNATTTSTLNTDPNEVTESMVSGVLSKYAYNTRVPVARLGSKVMPTDAQADNYASY